MDSWFYHYWLLELAKNTKIDDLQRYQTYEGVINMNKNIFYYIKRALFVAKHEGIKAVLANVFSKYKASRGNSTQQEEQSFPKISIVIPVYNALSMTQACLESIYRETQGVDFEVIVVDNASSDGTKSWLKKKQKEHDNLRVFRMKENIGFGPAVNKGFQYSKGEFVVILNNDTIVSHGWLNNLISAMDTDDAIGIISPVTNYVGEGPQIEKNVADLLPDVALINQYANEIDQRNEIVYEPNRLVFFCVMIRREVVDLIGGLDEGYEKGNFEDDDYCLRTRMVGYKLAITKNAFVYHHGTVTFKKNKISHSQWMETNRWYFYRKAGRIATTLHPRHYLEPSQEKKLSVILRTKNRPYLLQNALSSLVNQTYKDFEVVLVNDGGGDVSSLLDKYSRYFSINYIYHERSKGRTAAINVGLRNAKGTWVAYLDDDDILYPWHFDALLQTAERSNTRVVYGGCNLALLSDTDSMFPMRFVEMPRWDYNQRELLIQNRIPIHSYIHLRKCVDDIGYWDEKIDRLEDYEFLLRLSDAFDFHRMEKVSCEYRFYVNGENSISKGKHEYVDALHCIYEKHPVDDMELSQERQRIIDALRLQSRKMDEFLEKVGDTEIDKRATQREIIRLATGM